MKHDPNHRPRARRLPVRIHLDRCTLPMFLDSEIMNLSKGGVFIRSDLPLPPGGEIDFEFTLPHSKNTVRVLGVVVWSRRRGTAPAASFPDHPPGMGVQFKTLAAADVDAILNEIEQLIENS